MIINGWISQYVALDAVVVDGDGDGDSGAPGGDGSTDKHRWRLFFFVLFLQTVLFHHQLIMHVAGCIQ